MLFNNGNQHINGNSDPDLALYSILRNPEKRFDPQMLLNPFEKKFDLPAVTIQISYSLRWNGKVVGQKVEGLGRSALSRLKRALNHAKDANLKVPKLMGIARTLKVSEG